MRVQDVPEGRLEPLEPITTCWSVPLTSILVSLQLTKDPSALKFSDGEKSGRDKGTLHSYFEVACASYIADPHVYVNECSMMIVDAVDVNVKRFRLW